MFYSLVFYYFYVYKIKKYKLPYSIKVILYCKNFTNSFIKCSCIKSKTVVVYVLFYLMFIKSVKLFHSLKYYLVFWTVSFNLRIFF